MRVAAVLHQLFDANAFGHHRALRQKGQLAGQGLHCIALQRCAVELDLAALQRQLPCQQLEQGRFAAAVGADNADQLALGQLERDVLQHALRLVGKAQVVRAQLRR
ncbi:hypothetical protein D9M68_798140 [compost metagenome]